MFSAIFTKTKLIFSIYKAISTFKLPGSIADVLKPAAADPWFAVSKPSKSRALYYYFDYMIKVSASYSKSKCKFLMLNSKN